MSRVVLIRHNDDPVDDRVVTFFKSKGVDPEIRRPFKGDRLGDFDGSVVASVVYGGPFNVFEEDRHPFLHEENRWIEQCIRHEVPILGICQGAESMARVLGAEVGPKPDEHCEFGYYEIVPTQAGRTIFPETLVVALSHFHEFQLPKGAELLASSAAFRQQAFRYGTTAFAFQFHAEVTRQGFRRWQDGLSENFRRPGAQVRSEQDRLMALHDQRQHVWFMAFQEKLFGEALADHCTSRVRSEARSSP